MVYVRKKVIKGQEYYYLVKSIREKGKVKQITLKYLGKELPSEEELLRIKENLEKKELKLKS